MKVHSKLYRRIFAVESKAESESRNLLLYDNICRSCSSILNALALVSTHPQVLFLVACLFLPATYMSEIFYPWLLPPPAYRLLKLMLILPLSPVVFVTLTHRLSLRPLLLICPWLLCFFCPWLHVSSWLLRTLLLVWWWVTHISLAASLSCLYVPIVVSLAFPLCCFLVRVST